MDIWMNALKTGREIEFEYNNYFLNIIFKYKFIILQNH